MTRTTSRLFEPLELPNGQRLANRLIKSAMSDMLGDGRGAPTDAQMQLYSRWANGGLGASIVGEVQADRRFPEASGNLVLDENADKDSFRRLADAGCQSGSALWLQLGHAGALTPPELGEPAGPSALDMPDLKARALTIDEIKALPEAFGKTAARAERLGFAGVQIHAAHGFLLSQFLSPLFNRRSDPYGGPIENRMRLLVESAEAIQAAVSTGFTVTLKLNSSDALEGGLNEDDALKVIAALEHSGLDLIDISGGTYLPGASSSSDRSTSGPYFLDFAKAARRRTDTPLMITGGIKRVAEAEGAIASGAVDAIGLARAMVINPSLPHHWKRGGSDPVFPRFSNRVLGGVTAWYSLAIKAIAEGADAAPEPDARVALARIEQIKATQSKAWRAAAKCA